MGPRKSQINTPPFEKPTEPALRSWAQMGFVCESTGDGSPTLRLKSTDPRPESMHHSGGAWSESDLIYGQVLREAFDRLEEPRILSVGLGLGYNEILVAREAQRTGKSFQLVSFETVPALVQSFKASICNEKLQEEVLSVYEQIFSLVGVEPQKLRGQLQKADQEGRWNCSGDFVEFIPSTSYHVVLYDAFSSKTNPQLWDEKFLEERLKSSMDKDSLFATYACTGALKRALKRNLFEVEVREGFQGKRNSTRARRGLFSSVEGRQTY